MKTGEKIRMLRLNRGMTQEELGAVVGVQKAAINKYETDVVVNLRKETLIRLARELEVSVEWLLDDDAGWPPESRNDIDHVRIAWVAEMLARNGVQWPHRSDDIQDVEQLKRMWDLIIRKHIAKRLKK